jgi:FkbM family methyltransferase
MDYTPTQQKLKTICEEDIIYKTAYGQPYDNCYHDLYNDLFYKNYVFRNKLKDGFYVEIGALDGVINSQSFIFEKEFKWDGIVVEPNPLWHKNLETFRSCKISKSAISNKRGTAQFECREFPAFSGLVSNSNHHRISNIDTEILVETITLIDLFDKNDAPNVVDWVAIDTEGAEIDILSHFFENNTKYKINLINVESNDYDKLISLFKNQSYYKIKNPYLDFLRMNGENGLVKFEPITGIIYKSHHLNTNIIDFDNLTEITFEHYFVHKEYLKNNPHLKKLVI